MLPRRRPVGRGFSRRCSDGAARRRRARDARVRRREFDAARPPPVASPLAAVPWPARFCVWFALAVLICGVDKRVAAAYPGGAQEIGFVAGVIVGMGYYAIVKGP